MSTAAQPPKEPNSKILPTLAPGSVTASDAPAGENTAVEKSAVPLAQQETVRPDVGNLWANFRRAASSKTLRAEGAEQQPPLPKQIDQYEIVRELGRGAMGVVYEARQQGLNRTVALKMILAKAHAGADDFVRFRAEAEAVAHLQHPNIVQVYETGEHDGLPFFSQEFLPGGSLDDMLSGEPQPPRQAAELLRTLATAMGVAHRAGVVHRDLKPANVLLTKDGSPKITDFGLVKRLDLPTGQTASGMIMGTPSYMAPEQAQAHNNEICPASDVYALGAMLYEALTGRPPFKGPTALETIVQVVGDPPLPPSKLLPKIPRDLETICLKCLRKEPAKRYADAGALADDLNRFLGGQPILARPVALWERTWLWMKRWPFWTVIIVLAILSVLRVGITMWWDARAQGEIRSKAISAYERLIALQVQQSQWAEFDQTAEECLNLDKNNPDLLFTLARGYAQAARAGGTNQERYATRAIELLEQAQKAGYFLYAANVEQLKNDAAFDGIRQRDEFRRLLAK
jgi:hypothetical protein